MIAYLIAVIVILCVLHVLLNYNSRARIVKKIPGPNDAFIVGNALDLIRSPVESWKLDRIYAKKWNGIYRFWAYPFAAVTIYNPPDVEVISRYLGMFSVIFIFTIYTDARICIPIPWRSIRSDFFQKIVWGVILLPTFHSAQDHATV